jgi:hypothetical protein
MGLTETGSRKISELYPDVTRVVLFVAFQQAAAGADANYQQIIFTPDSEAVFRLDCSRDDCVDGGFDYGPHVAELIASGESRSHGRIACEGWLGNGENRRHCSLQSEYRIVVD